MFTISKDAKEYLNKIGKRQIRLAFEIPIPAGG
jgi:hypothetical protein